mgnify:CR=1 FL=1
MLMKLTLQLLQMFMALKVVFMKDLYILKKPEEKPKKNAVGSFGNYDQRNFDYRDAEKKLRGYDKKEDDEDEIH